MQGDDPDAGLVKAAQSGESDAFDELMTRHRQRIFHFILRHISNESDAWELAQETFVRAFFNIGKFSPNGLFSTWLHQIALNLCRDLVRSKTWRNRQQTDSLSSHPKSAEPSPRSSASPEEEMAKLERAIRQLPLELKVPLLLTSMDGFSHIEAGMRLGLSAKAIELRVYRAKKALRRLLDQSGEEPE